MDVNTPLHGQVHLWGIIALIIAGYIAVIINKAYVLDHSENRKATNIVLGIIFFVYLSGFSYLCVFYRTPMEESHIRLEPFWSYIEAFFGNGNIRLGVARSILLNIMITIPLGYWLPAVYRKTSHRYSYTLLTVLALSLVTELMQFLTRTGLCETDDVIDNILGAVIGLIAYKAGDYFVKKVLKR